MNNLKPKLKRIFLFLIPILFIGSLLLLYINRGFYFTDFKNRIEVKASSAEETQIDNLFNNFKQNSNVAYLDREHRTIGFQYIDAAGVESQINSFKSDDLSLEITEVSVNNRSLLESYLTAFVIILVISSGAIFYTVLRNRGIMKYSELLRFFVPYLASYLITSVIFFGLLSLISRVYFITEFSFFIIYFINIGISIIFFLGVRDSNEEIIETLIISRKYFAKLNHIALPFLIFTLMFIPALALSFGVKTIPIWLSLIAALGIIYLSIKWIYEVSYYNFSIQNFRDSLNRLRVKRSKENTIQKKLETNPTKAKDKDKKKKKKKNKK